MRPGLQTPRGEGRERDETNAGPEPGRRATFKNIVSHMLPEARVQFDSRVKQQLYRAISQLKEYSVDLDFTTTFIHSAATPAEPAATSQKSFLEHAVVADMLGMRRMRPNTVIRLTACDIQFCRWGGKRAKRLPARRQNSARVHKKITGSATRSASHPEIRQQNG